MADVHEPDVRSYNMSRIKSTDTKPEMIVRKFLHGNGLRYSLHNKKLPGKPDLTLAKYNTVVFVNGCFWHGHKNCRYFRLPKTRTEWWKNKIKKTKKRDKNAINDLKELEWNTEVVWECELKKNKRIKTLKNLLNNIRENLK